MSDDRIATLREVLEVVRQQIEEVSGLLGVKAYAVPDSPYQSPEVQFLVELYYKIERLVLLEELSIHQYIAWANEEDRIADA